jgi:hypothetical protein
MPNHVSSILFITGPTIDVRRFVSSVNTNEDDKFDFNGIVPMPDELRGTRSPVLIQTQQEIETLWSEWNRRKNAGELNEWEIKEGKPFGLGITQNEHDGLIAKYGYADWYTWSCDNWGTKWSSYYVSEWNVIDGENDNSTAEIKYSTAWSPATEFFVRASKVFPSLYFITKYADEGGGFVCRTDFQNGNVVLTTDYEWDGEDGIDIRKLVGYGPDEDEEIE